MYIASGESILAVDKIKQKPLHKKWSFPLRISSVNVTKSAGDWGFGHITEEIVNEKGVGSSFYVPVIAVLMPELPVFLLG